jgi:branched-subunit amino acid aminotransferase/4-amino-4-deoxychorismate lyase
MATVLINGEFLEPNDARIGVFDAGLQHGVGLFETMTAMVAGGEAKVVSLDEHLDRLIESAKELGLVRELHKAPLEEAVLSTVERAGVAKQRVRLTLTGGDMNMIARDPAQSHQPTVIVATQPLGQYPEEMYAAGVSVTVADLRVNPLDESQGHKTLNYWMRLRELQKAASKRASEALVFQVTNYLAGGCVSNAIIVKNDVVVTPIARGEEGLEHAAPQAGITMRSPVLPGITRGMLLAWAAAEGRTIEKRMVSIDDVLKADELLLCNSIFGVVPVVRMEREQIGTGSPGPCAASMIAHWTQATAS